MMKYGFCMIISGNSKYLLMVIGANFKMSLVMGLRTDDDAIPSLRKFPCIFSLLSQVIWVATLSVDSKMLGEYCASSKLL